MREEDEGGRKEGKERKKEKGSHISIIIEYKNCALLCLALPSLPN